MPTGQNAERLSNTCACDESPKICIYRGGKRPAVPPHPMDGPQPAFRDDESRDALTAHQARQRLPAATGGEARNG